MLYFVFRDINNIVMELLIMAYACKTSTARKVVGVIPYIPYSRQCKLKYPTFLLHFNYFLIAFHCHVFFINSLTRQGASWAFWLKLKMLLRKTLKSFKSSLHFFGGYMSVLRNVFEIQMCIQTVLNIQFLLPRLMKLYPMLIAFSNLIRNVFVGQHSL